MAVVLAGIVAVTVMVWSSRRQPASAGPYGV